MSMSSSCFEIVHFTFQPAVPLPRQVELMRTLGQWAATQAGFVARQGFHDPSSGRWTDVVEWRSAADAQAAMAASAHEPALAEAMGAIAPQGLSIGHCERLV